jgi:hypothetical protein
MTVPPSRATRKGVKALAQDGFARHGRPSHHRHQVHIDAAHHHNLHIALISRSGSAVFAGAIHFPGHLSSEMDKSGAAGLRL